MPLCNSTVCVSGNKVPVNKGISNDEKSRKWKAPDVFNHFSKLMKVLIFIKQCGDMCFWSKLFKKKTKKNSLVRTRTCAGLLMDGYISQPHSHTLPCRLHTCITAPCAHAGGQQRPFVRHRIVKLYGRQVAAAVVSPHHVQQVVHGAHAWAETRTWKVRGQRSSRKATSQNHDDVRACVRYQRCVDTCSCRPPVASCCCLDHKPRNSSSPGGRRGRPRRTAGLSARLRLQWKMSRWRSVYLTVFSEKEEA